MKLDIRNHLFLLEVSLRLQTDMRNMIEIFDATEQMLSDFRALQKDSQGETSDCLSDDFAAMAEADVEDATVVREAYDKLSNAYIEAFTSVSDHHIKRAEAHEAQAAA